LDLLLFGLSPQAGGNPVFDVLAERRHRVRSVVTHGELVRAATAASGIILIVTTGGNEAALNLTQELRGLNPRCPLLVIAANTSEDFAIAAFRVGATDLLKQFCSRADAEACVDRILGPHSVPTGRPVQGVGRAAVVMVGDGPAMQRTRAAIERAAATDLNVLITGETGTGKELAAELIHRQSRRCAHSFVAINCAAIPSGLLESELFGYERGAFTGAHATRDGKLPSARGGTVFLDEIGDMDLYSQAKILRAIESRQVQRLGSHRDIPLDIRFVAATNQNLEGLAAQGRFRQDLYFRLNVVRIHVAPLRERPEDLPALVRHILDELNAASGRSVAIADALVAGFETYQWPGNIRELRNVIESAFAFCTSDCITPVDLPAEVLQKLRIPLDPADAERDRVLHALTSAQWNKSEAARLLHWSRMTLYRKMSRHGIDPERKTASCDTSPSAATA
jgi:DNA-binding NtrC family response regulator